ncbi:MAG: hypothetical protein JXR64_02990 [Spirochaetales bacterium]|nr:hypothetical protein [Spirochaetales bacterium]
MESNEVKVKEDDMLSSVPDLVEAKEDHGVQDTSTQKSGDQNDNGAENNGNVVVDGYIPNPIWNVLSSRLSTETNPYELPDPIKKGKIDENTALTPEQEFDLITKIIQENTRIPELEDEDVRNLIAAKRAEDFSMDSFMKQYSTQTEMSSLSDYDYMFKVIKEESGKSEDRPNGFTDEDITEYLSTQNKISLRKERENKDKAIKQQREEYLQTAEARRIQKLKDEIKEKEIVEAPVLEQTIDHFIKNPKINGIEFGESEIKDAAEEFRLLNKYDENGHKPLFDIFMDNNNLFSAYMFLRNNGELVKQIFSSVKSDAAKNILDRTGLKPADANKSFGGTASKIPTPEDFLNG